MRKDNWTRYDSIIRMITDGLCDLTIEDGDINIHELSTICEDNDILRDYIIENNDLSDDDKDILEKEMSHEIWGFVNNSGHHEELEEMGVIE